MYLRLQVPRSLLPSHALDLPYSSGDHENDGPHFERPHMQAAFLLWIDTFCLRSWIKFGRGVSFIKNSQTIASHAQQLVSRNLPSSRYTFSFMGFVSAPFTNRH
jgi:hypothetical protein